MYIFILFLECGADGNIIKITAANAANIYDVTTRNTGELDTPLCTLTNGTCIPTPAETFQVVISKEKNSDRKGGQLWFYELKCLSPNIKMNVSASAFTVVPSTFTNATSIAKNFPVDKVKLSLTLYVAGESASLKRPVPIGTHLKLKMAISGSTPYNVIQPDLCYAQTIDVTTPPPAVHIWNFCKNSENDEAVIGNTWITSRPSTESEVEIDVYAFRFVGSDQVNITCETLVCSSKCSVNCNNRRRRETETDSKSITVKKSSVSFRVLGNDEIQNGARGLSAPHCLIISAILSFFTQLKKLL